MRRIQALVAISLAVLVAACVGLYGDRLFSTPPLPENSNALSTEVDPILKARAIHLDAMAGTWERLGAGGVPARLLVRQASPEFAVLNVALDRNNPGVDDLEWVTVRAKILDDGRLFWKHPGEFNLELSEDHATLIGTKRHLGKSAQFLMRKVEAPDPAGLIPHASNLGS